MLFSSWRLHPLEPAPLMYVPFAARARVYSLLITKVLYTSQALLVAGIANIH